MKSNKKVLAKLRFSIPCCLCALQRTICDHREAETAGRKDRSLGTLGQVFTTARACMESVRPLAGVLPGFGYQIQSLLDLGIAVISSIEQLQAMDAVKSDLCRKVNYVFEMIKTALDHPNAEATPDLKKDLDLIKKILSRMREFVDKKARKCKHFRFFGRRSDYQVILEYGAQFDDAVKMLVINSSVHIRLELQDLKELVQSGNAAVGNSLENYAMSNKRALDEIKSGMSRMEAEITTLSSASTPKLEDLHECTYKEEPNKSGRSNQEYIGYPETKVWKEGKQERSTFLEAGYLDCRSSEFRDLTTLSTSLDSYKTVTIDSEDSYEMVQYGAAKDYDGSHEPLWDEPRGGESSALLDSEGSSRALRQKRDGVASLLSSTGNLANTIIGSGMLTFPLAMASAGIIPGMISCIACGFIAAFGLYLLSRCAAYTAHRGSSFFAVAKLTFPNAAVFFDAAIATKCFGVSISYLIIIKSLMPNVVQSLYHDLTAPDVDPPAWAVSGRVWISLFMAILIPLCFLRRLDSLRHTSYIALFSVVYLVLIVIVCYFNPPEGIPSRGEVHLIHFTPTFVSTFPVQVFAFTCAQNLFPIYNELATNSQQRMNIVIGSAIGGAAITYEVIAIFGYLTFGTNVGANIIAMYPSTSLFIAIGQLAIVILVLFSYPLQVHPCRNCLDKVFHDSEALIHDKPPADDDESDVLDLDHIPHEMSPFKHTMLTAGIIACGFAIAFFVDDLQLVLSFVGSTGSTTISFILPGLFFWKLTQDDASVSRTLNRAALTLAIYGGFIFVFCLSFNIYQVFRLSGH